MATSFKPKNANTTSSFSGETFNVPTPRSGSRKARISLIVDLGIQIREDFVDEVTKEVKPQKPCQQVAVFADLVADIVDYGGSIGKAPYRLMINGSFSGKIKGINFTASPPKDAKGNTIQGKPWGLHPQNALTKIAKAVKKPDVITSMDIAQLLDIPFMAAVDVSEKDSEKLNKDGEPIIYKNVNFKGATEVPLDDNDEPLSVAELQVKPMCITFDDAEPHQIKFIRKGVLDMIKQATNYTGSRMQQAVELFEAGAYDVQDDEFGQAVKAETKPLAKAVVKKVRPPVDDTDDLDQAPF